jgi:hypothetical protein
MVIKMNKRFRIFGAALALVSSVSFAQMNNPGAPGNVTAGSGLAQAGQVLSVGNYGTGTAIDNIGGFSGTGFMTRTGSGTYAFQSATNGITLGNIAQAAANTVLANVSGSTANVAAFAMPGCTGATNAIGYTSGTGFVCNSAINAATLGGATFAAPGNIGGTTPGTGAFTTLGGTAVTASTSLTAPTLAIGNNTTGGATTAFVANHEGCPAIMDNGGDNTDTNDNTAALAATLAKSTSINQCVYFRPGTYKFASQQNISVSSTSYSSITLVGAGSEQTFLTFPSTAGIEVTENSQYNIFHIRGMSITAGTTNNGDGVYINQTATPIADAANSPVSDFTDVVLRGADGAGNTDYWTTAIEVSNQSNINFNSVTISGTSTYQGTGVYIHGTVNDPPNVFNFSGFTGNWLNVGFQYGNYVQGVTFNYSNFTGDNYGIVSNASLSVLVQLAVNNSQFNCFDSGIALNTAIPDLLVHGNLFFIKGPSSGTNEGIALNSTGRYSITGNSFTGYGTTANDDAIVVNTNVSSAGVIAGNSFDAVGFGIVLQSPSTDNNVQSNAYHGVGTAVSNSGTGNTVGGGSQ